MAVIPENWGAGGVPITPYGTSSQPTLATFGREAADDFEELRAKFIALLTQLDTEAGLGGGYVAGFTPAVMKTQKA